MDKENLKDELIKYSTTFTNSSITCEGVTLPLIKNVIDNFDDTPTTEQAWEKIAEEYKLPVETVQQIAGTTISSAVKKEDIAISDGCIILNPNLTEPEKPEIPKFVADWIEEVKQRGCGLADALNCFVSPIMPEKVKQWIQFDFAAIGCHHDNQESLAKAWLNGYTIEKEPVWVVKAGGSYVTSIDYDFYDWTIGTTINKDDESILTFTDKQKAEAVATLVDGVVGEWSE